MRKAMFGALALALLPMGCKTTGVPGDFGTILGDVMGSSTSQGSLSQAEIDAGLREALTVGTNLVAAQLGKTDGLLWRSAHPHSPAEDLSRYPDQSGPRRRQRPARRP